jgi:hypothetical protein
MHVDDVEVGLGVPKLREICKREDLGLVRRVIEHLNLEAIPGVTKGGYVVEQTPDHRGLIEDGKLHGHVGEGPLVVRRKRRQAVAHFLEATAEAQTRQHQMRAVEAIHREEQEHGEIRRAQAELHAETLAKAPPDTCHPLVIRCTLLSHVMVCLQWAGPASLRLSLPASHRFRGEVHPCL